MPNTILNSIHIELDNVFGIHAWAGANNVSMNLINSNCAKHWLGNNKTKQYIDNNHKLYMNDFMFTTSYNTREGGGTSNFFRKNMQ